MYKEKFNYQKLNRISVDGERRYLCPSGNKLPSVTTILDATKPKERVQKLQEWRRRVGTERAQQITTEAANRGTKMHSFLERYIKEGTVPDKPGNIFHHPSWHMANEVINRGLSNCSEFWGIEVPLYFPDIYAGTTDCVGIHLGQESIIDFKQTNKPKQRSWIDDYFLQLCAYAAAHNEIHGTNINRGVIMMCVKPEVVNETTVVGTPEYQEFILEGTDFQKYTNSWWNRVEQYYLKV